MDTQSIVTYKSAFDSIMHEIEADDGSKMEVWYARELQTVCGYARWENFAIAINRAKDACKTQNISIDDHFRDVTKMVSLGSGSEREITDIQELANLKSQIVTTSWGGDRRVGRNK